MTFSFPFSLWLLNLFNKNIKGRHSNAMTARGVITCFITCKSGFEIKPLRRIGLSDFYFKNKLTATDKCLYVC